jgi:hypothetical protein
MTLVVVGHEHAEGWSRVWRSDEDANGHKTKIPEPMEPGGLFIVADSAITSPSSGQTLLGGFQKVYPIPIKVWEPYFVGMYFHSYQTVWLESECFVAIAGSTLIAQHVLNAIEEHLGSLRITFAHKESLLAPGEYKVAMACEENELLRGAGIDQWDEEMFLRQHFEKLVTADVIARTVQHAIDAALLSAQKYKLDEKSLRDMTTDFALGVTCPVSRAERLFTYRMKSEILEGRVRVFAEMKETQHHEVAVLGMRRKFEARAQAAFDLALSEHKSPSKELFEFLNIAINEVGAAGSFEIDRPSFLKKFRGGKLKNEGRRK